MIFVGAHHKTGSLLFKKIFADISKNLGVRFYLGWQENLPPSTDIWCMEHSIIDPRRLPIVKGVHVVRHPLEVIASAYRWHLMCREPWCISTDELTAAVGIRYAFDGKSYQEKLRTLPQPEGILFEMKGRSFHSIMDMYRWNYRDPRFLNVRFEDVTRDFDRTVARTLAFVGLDPARCLPVAARHDLNRLTAEQVEGLRHVTNKAGGVTWTRYFSDPALLDAFRSTFPEDVFAKLGYAEDFGEQTLSAQKRAKTTLRDIETGRRGKAP